MYCLHDQNISHLDLKTANLLIDHNGEVKIADLGLGKLVVGRDTTATQWGTFEWMAPEQILNGKSGLASDIWALSVIMWEVILPVSLPFPLSRPPLSLLYGKASCSFTLSLSLPK